MKILEKGDIYLYRIINFRSLLENDLFLFFLENDMILDF